MRKVHLIPIAVLLCAVAVFCGSMQGCGTGGWYTCANPAFDHKDYAGRPDPCCENSICCPNPLVTHYSPDPGREPPRMMWDPCCMEEDCPDGHNPWLPPDAGVPNEDSGGHASCEGECVPAAPRDWFGPTLLWTGIPGQEPECPSYAHHEVYKGYADLAPEPVTCAQCACDPPTGTCALPAGLTAHSSACQESAGGAVHTDFSPPAGWDGGCTAQHAVPAGAKCNGDLCVTSLSIESLTLVESGCTAHPVIPKAAPQHPSLAPPWKTSAIACQLNCYPSCGSGEEVCAPSDSASAPAGFSTCIYAQGDTLTCPEEYPARHVFYAGYSDTRTCTDCTCDSPVGGQCEATISVYQNGTCTGAHVFGDLKIINKEAPYCLDLTPGLALGSKTITAPTYTPGACTPHGGEQTGAIVEVGPATFCCLQS